MEQIGILDTLIRVITGAYEALTPKNRLKHLVLASKQRDNGHLLHELLKLEEAIQEKENGKKE